MNNEKLRVRDALKQRVDKRVDRVCIKPIVKELNTHFLKGGTVQSAWERRHELKSILDEQQIDPRFKAVHAFAATGFAMGAVILYESLRSKNPNLPNSAEIASLVVPGLSISGPRFRVVDDRPTADWEMTGKVSADGRPFIRNRKNLDGVEYDVYKERAEYLTGQHLEERGK